jgi:hypothetical protein
MKVRLATVDDEPQLRRLAWRTAMGGRWKLVRPATVRPGAETVVVEAGGRVVGCGQRVKMERFVNGRLTPVAYLGTLRVDPATTSPGRVLRDGYGLLGELHRSDPRPTFTSIMDGNDAAIRLLTRPRRTLPRYEWLTNYLTAVLPGRRVREVRAASEPAASAAPPPPRSGGATHA